MVEKKKSIKRNLGSDTVREMERWAAALGEVAAALALKEWTQLLAGIHAIGLDPDRYAQRQATAAERAAKKIADRVKKEAIGSFWFESQIPSLLAAQTRSHKATVARCRVENPRGASKKPWRNAVTKLYANQRFMQKNPTQDQVIERLITDLIIDDDGETGDGAYNDHATGERIAKSKKNLLAELSRIKKTVSKHH